jgi:hypothetical protein
MRNIQKLNVFQQGLIWGILLGIVDVILGLIGTLAHVSVLGILALIIGLVTYLFVGLRASQGTGKTGTGALVGLFTGLFSAIIGAIGTLVTTFANIDALRQSAQSAADKLQQSIHATGNTAIHVTNNTVILGVIFGAIGGLVLALVLGAIVGAIGGAIGKGRARNRSIPEYSELSAR